MTWFDNDPDRLKTWRSACSRNSATRSKSITFFRKMFITFWRSIVETCATFHLKENGKLFKFGSKQILGIIPARWSNLIFQMSSEIRKLNSVFFHSNCMKTITFEKFAYIQIEELAILCQMWLFLSFYNVFLKRYINIVRKNVMESSPVGELHAQKPIQLLG